ncbi:MAG: lamin tail domain-containing protein [Verrucomicrobiota bacterium]|nr:lamin tail domain-containing protein [Verrucomicrobiota bacterium]
MLKRLEARTPLPFKAVGIFLVFGMGLICSWSAQVKDTKFSVDRGFFVEPFVLNISSATPRAQIRYTTDGSNPSLYNGKDYSGPIILNKTTVIRAVAFKEGYDPTDVDTHTYIFLEDVIRQTGKNMPSNWGPFGRFDTVPGDLEPGPYAGDYEMDQDIVNDPKYADNIKEDMRSIPTLAVSLDPEDLFSIVPVQIDAENNVIQTRGIYPIGKGFERAASAELILPEGSTGFQIDCSLEIQGATSTDRWKTDKLSMRLKFKPPYGPPELDYPLFGDEATDNINTVILDATNQQSWTHPDPDQQLRAQYIRDQFVGDLQNAAGGIAPRGNYAHLYLNGFYWGMYWLHEFVDEEFVVAYRGGKKSHYDILRHRSTNVVAGDNKSYEELLSLIDTDLTIDGNYRAVLELLDLERFIDYILINFYAGNADWAFQNWNASYNRKDPEQSWIFHNWDAEKTFQQVNDDVTDANDKGSPTWIHQQLRTNSEYRFKFADRAHHLMFNDGVLTPELASSIYASRLMEIDRAIVAESARWGDNRNPDKIPYTRATWVNERDRLLTDFFPERTRVLLSQLKIQSLYPSVEAPIFSQYGGNVESNFILKFGEPSGAGRIFYTNDGTDPRGSGGEISANALEGNQIKIASSVNIKARIFNEMDNTWSALTDAVFFVKSGAEDLRVTEMMYKPNISSTAEKNAGYEDRDVFEYIELTNVGSNDVDLSGVNFTKGIRFAFESGSLSPGESIIVANDIEAFQMRYGTDGFHVAGQYNGTLSNSGETIKLSGKFGNTIQEFRYEDSWYPPTDGKGRSLVAVDYDAPVEKWNLSEGWRSSKLAGGSPGYFETPLPPLRISEIHFNPTDPTENERLEGFNNNDVFEFIEFQNVGSLPIQLEGYRISDAVDFTFGPYALGPGEYAVVVADAEAFVMRYGKGLNLIGLFENGRLDDSGERIRLYSNKEELIHDFRYSSDWYPESDGIGSSIETVSNYEQLFRWRRASHWKPSSDRDGSPGRAGRSLPNSPIRITELMFNPGPPTEEEKVAGFIENDDFEFIELVNISSEEHNLLNYELLGAVRIRFNDFSIQPGQRVVVVKRLRAFRARYGDSVRVIGEYSGNLNNNYERLILSDPSDQTILDFNYFGNWYVSTDGEGHSLNIVNTDRGSVFWSAEDGWRPSHAIHGSPGKESDPYFSWVWDNFSDSEAIDPNISGELHDPDNDNLANVIEYALGTDPSSYDEGSFHSVFDEDGKRFMVLTHTTNGSATDVEIALERSSDLRTWDAVNPLPENYIYSELKGGIQQRTAIDNVPISLGVRRFYRLIIRR